MLNSIFFFVLLLAILMLPGTAFINAFRLRGIEIPYRLLISVSLSYGLFSIVVVITRSAQLSFSQLTNIIFGYLLFSMLLLVLCSWRLKPSLYERINLSDICATLLVNIPSILIVVILAIYHLLVGAYTEIPADIFYHIEKFRRVQEGFLEGELDPLGSFFQVFKQEVEVWYHLLAWVTLQTKTSTGQTVQIASLVSQGVFLLAVFEFSKRIFITKINAEIIALLATLLVAIHMGVTAFSYLRYYALAPTMLGFVIYFAAVVVFWDLLVKRSFEHSLGKISFLCFALFATILIHTQEAMFIVILCSVMLCVFAVGIIIGRNGEPRFKVWQRSWFDRTVFFAALGVVIVFVVMYVYMHFNFVHFGNNGNRLWEFGPSIGILPQLAILNPSYQFMQVVTAWGVLVYILFFLHWRRYKHNVFLISGMLLPMFTIFNPFFTDLFLRVTDSTVLWRFCFLIPIHYVAADLMLHYLQPLISSNAISNSSIPKNFRDRNKKYQLLGIVGLAGLLVLLVPFMNGWNGLHFSRYPTLRTVSHQQSYQHLDDAIVFLESLPDKKIILTDPVTGYVLSGFTKHHSYRDKFFINEHSGFKKFTFDEYSNDPLMRYTDHLMVINERTIQNGDSFVGAITRHWPTNLFERIQPFYTTKLKKHLSASPEKFELLFEQDKLFIYLLK